MARPSITRAHRVLIGVVAAGACLIAGIGFAGSYNAVRELAVRKGFGTFAYAFPVGIDAGIVVLLSLDLVLTWLRIPFPLLRQTAWGLTGATVVFNAAASYPDPLGMGMHAAIPVLFVVVVEAARHAVGRIADITADRHMESVRLVRWLLAPVPTFRLWRRMKLWELRSYDEVVRHEQNRLVYRARLRARYGRAWRRTAPIDALLPLRLARYGVPLELAQERVGEAVEPSEPARPALEQSVPIPGQRSGPVKPAPLAEPEPEHAVRAYDPLREPAHDPSHDPAHDRAEVQSEPEPEAAVVPLVASANGRRPLRVPEPQPALAPEPEHAPRPERPAGPAPEPVPELEPEPEPGPSTDEEWLGVYLDGLVSYIDYYGRDPDHYRLSQYLQGRGVTPNTDHLRRFWPQLQERYAALERQ